MKNGSGVLAAEFPPGIGDFDFVSLIPGLQDTVWGPMFTKITLLVWIAVAFWIVFFLVTYRTPKLVPTKKQWLAESLYGFVRDGIAKEVIGAEGVRFAPYLTCLFCFVLLTNLFGIIPLAQISPNSHFAFPVFLAVITYLLFNYVGIRKHGAVKYFKDNIFMPGVPWWIYPILAPVELISTFVFRPFTLAVRLFANMFAGHLMLLIFTLGGFALLGSANIGLMLASGVSFAMAIAITFLEVAIQLIQAYVFTMLTASYLQGALAEH
ncbi:MAG: F0F1 ATP synthase subunit A [Micromonosporaceae bacterium]